MNIERKRRFTGIWVPAKIWLDKTLSPLDKMLLVEIDSQANEEGGCAHPANEELAEFFGVTPGIIAERLRALEKKGRIVVYEVCAGRCIKIADSCPATPDPVPAPSPTPVKVTAPKQEPFPPLLDAVADYITSIDLPESEAEKFFDYWTSRGWMRGKTKIKDWRASARYWAANWRERQPASRQPKRIGCYD